MYRNNSKYTSTLVWSILGLVFGIGPTLFWLFLFVACFVTGEIEVSVIVFSLFFIAIGAAFIVLGIRGLCTVSVVSCCCRYFDSDPDGIIEMDSILQNKGASYERKILRVIDKGYFERVAYDRAYRAFELSDRVSNMEEYRNRFIGKNCPNCGTPLKIKKGMSVTCDRCGKKVSA